ncbi:hypothetical protein F2S72_09525 [Pseudomonas syringae pv. actinidiae]|nr:hypothetical protein [Pseudomonas syringae pv. actinidiae]
MRIHTSAVLADLKTVKRQGECIAQAWKDQNRTPVDVMAIKRLGNTSAENQWGFVVLESIFSTYLCHYSFEGSGYGIRLVVTPENRLSIDSPSYLACPQKLLDLAKAENSYWRDGVRTYREALKEITPEALGNSATLFLMREYSQREYGEPFHVLQIEGSQWFGVDCYGRKRPLSLNLNTVLEHCPRLINQDALKAYDPAKLAHDCVDTGVLIYKECDDKVILLGRSMTKLEIANDRLSSVAGYHFELHGECPWAA